MVIYFYIEHLSNSVVHNGRLFWDTLQQFNLSQINCAGFRCGSSLDSENEPRHHPVDSLGTCPIQTAFFLNLPIFFVRSVSRNKLSARESGIEMARVSIFSD